MENKDKGLPFSKYPNRVIQQLFPQDKPIFWGPNQYTEYPSTYNEPSGWNPNELLTIPKVLRVFKGTKAGKCSCSGIHCIWNLLAFYQFKRVAIKYPYSVGSADSEYAIPYPVIPPDPDPYLGLYYYLGSLSADAARIVKIYDTSSVDPDGLCRTVVYNGPFITTPGLFVVTSFMNAVSWKKTCTLRYGGDTVIGCDNAFAIQYVSTDELGELNCIRNEKLVLNLSPGIDNNGTGTQSDVTVSLVGLATDFSDYPVYLPEDCLDDPDPCA